MSGASARHVIWDMFGGAVDVPPSAALLGWKGRTIEPGNVCVEFLADARFLNIQGMVQGGYLAAMLDSTMTPAAMSALEHGDQVVTLEMKVSYLSPARAGVLIGEGKLLKQGRSVAFVEGRLSMHDGPIVATATATCRVVRNTISLD
jgi:uncharacterized protein (TIGR00369 family)